MVVYPIFERCHGCDQLREVWDCEEGADKRCDELNAKHPRSDGFYYGSIEVMSNTNHEK